MTKKTVEVTYLKKSGIHARGEVARVDEVKARQLIQRKIATKGRQRVRLTKSAAGYADRQMRPGQR